MVHLPLQVNSNILLYIDHVAYLDKALDTLKVVIWRKALPAQLLVNYIHTVVIAVCNHSSSF